MKIYDLGILEEAFLENGNNLSVAIEVFKVKTCVNLSKNNFPQLKLERVVKILRLNKKVPKQFFYLA